MEKEIICYKGNLAAGESQWIDNDPGNETGLFAYSIHEVISFRTANYNTACTVKANLQNIPIPLCFGARGTYYEIMVDIILLFGVTELKAQIAWMENVCCSPFGFGLSLLTSFHRASRRGLSHRLKYFQLRTTTNHAS